ncbi:homocysteine S-methyltransferase family protein [Mameliella sediminis]|uniref:homocysteine S-methyltransferase family protein n=1 Tax=Mameliella sediminis TaxID=2836866 RepID=UPI001C44BA5A|nr:homocysteine S-methyltransferase family protein [Mameliella sediminis]MBV7396164.1 homocysteine S-methyltransferase family protein [Mameliella sediminis]MBY6115058.1 homocysteine S-methyltransferase family protein [Antarctobacter heliothermus]MBY6145057.1 homocysteine S-methyltransferase family protein [Mameliella alba]MCA0955866.1 homocysteine S-methyltransferase family protein [Mameliella alba]
MTEVTLMDGGMGQLLQHRSKLPASNMWSAKSMLEEPELVQDLHAEYIAAGAQTITINAYAATPERLEERGFGDQFIPLQQAAIAAAKRAVEASGRDVKITGCLPPLFNSYNPDLNKDEAFARDVYKRVVKAQAEVDIHLAETLGSLLEVRAVLAAFEGEDKPCWISVTLDDRADPPALRSGEPLSEAIALAKAAGVDAFLVNCSMPEVLSKAMPLLKASGLKFGAYANGFHSVIPLTNDNVVIDTLTAREDLGPQAYADFVEGWIAEGATIVGGCCETGPEHIAELSRRLHPG